MGDLGFRELETFNDALLTKMSARIPQEPNGLWVWITKGLYIPNSNVWLANQARMGV